MHPKGEDLAISADILPMALPAAQAQKKIRPDSQLAQRFSIINQHRLRRVLDSLTPRQKSFVEIIPLLLHINHPLLPGYKSKGIPAGIADYAPGQQALKLARNIAKAFTYEHRLLKFFPIKGLYLMGSPGTIAYSKHSDLDMWLCHDPSLSEEQTASLKAKARDIERSAEKLGLEAHFFVFSAEAFREGKTLSLSAESSGSSQHALLLDEFYRSGLLLAGLPPVWWSVPSEHEHRYDQFVEELSSSDPGFARDHLNFGGLMGIPAQEFFGAGIWQLYKSVDSPFKSVLKLLLMESYVAEYPQIDLLSYRYKRLVASANTALNDVDPYLLMYRKVEEYLRAKGDLDRLSLMQRCFYLKVRLPLTQLTARGIEDNWQYDLLVDIVRKLDWTDAELKHLDDRDDWKIRDAITERLGIVRTLHKSYAALSTFARTCGDDQSITGEDLNILGRKLYAAFERKPAKIDVVTRGICKAPMENELTIRWRKDETDNDVWSLYTERLNLDHTGDTKPVKSAPSLTSLLAWCHFNHLYHRGTNWHIVAPDSRLHSYDLQRALAKIESFYPSGHIVDLGTNALTKIVKPHKTLLLINLGQDPLQGKLSQTVLTTNSTDAFKFGGQKINLIQSASMIMMTSWEEVYESSFTGPYAVQEFLVEYLHWVLHAQDTNIPSVEVFCGCRDYAQAVQKSVDAYVSNVIKFIWQHKDAKHLRYISQIESGYVAVTCSESQPRFDHYASYHTLLKSFSIPNSSYPVQQFDHEAEDTKLLKLLYETSRESQIYFFVQERQSKAEVYVIDEQGSLFVQKQDNHQTELTIEHFRQFFENILARPLTSPARVNIQSTAPQINFYKLVEDKHRCLCAIPYAPLHDATMNYIPLKVFVDLDNQNEQILTMLIDEHEFSTRHHGASLFQEIAKFIASRRDTNLPYPIHINDLEFSFRYQSDRKISHLQTIHLLNFKKRIEYQLSKALTNLKKQAAIEMLD